MGLLPKRGACNFIIITKLNESVPPPLLGYVSEQVCHLHSFYSFQASQLGGGPTRLDSGGQMSEGCVLLLFVACIHVAWIHLPAHKLGFYSNGYSFSRQLTFFFYGPGFCRQLF